ncbi:hypothetical protein [Desulfofalx alkaliphila]|uniref:hypothetical protein n=1 Tax=Desulfofalx alkaliphila TaxID=105483 RepID=UPI0004E0C282|nr:hypothetical protein [Desulfofalx alkaliphila]
MAEKGIKVLEQQIEISANSQIIKGEDLEKLWSFLQQIKLLEGYLEDIYQLEDIVVYKCADYWRIALNNGEEWSEISISLKESQ